jgi:hypothetical protein
MLPMFVAVIGNSRDLRFAVTEFSIVGRASTKLITPPFSQSQPIGCVVACSGKLAVVGAYQQTTAWIYDLSNPAHPQRILDSTLGVGNGIGTLSLDGTNLLVGQFNGPSVVLLDINTGDVLATGTVEDFSGGITALALKGTTAIVSGLDNFDVLNYAPSGTPGMLGTLTATPYVGIDLPGPVTCDFDGSTAVVGFTDIQGGHVCAFNIVDGALVPGVPTQYGALDGVSSVTVSGNQVAAGAIGEILVALISLGSPDSNNNFVAVDNSDGQPGAVVKFYGSSNLAAANNNGVIYFSSRVWPNPTQFGVATGFGLSTDGFTTVGFTEVEQFRPLPIPRWLQPLLQKMFG